MGNITLNKVTKKFGDTEVIPPINLELSEGEFLVFVGPSGCGKSTLPRLIAGLEDVTSGVIEIDGRDATRIPPAKRGLAMVFQSYALYRRVDNAAKVLNLTDYLKRRPGQLSGGQRQRVAIGRAIVREPAAFLFDEPLSNLDAALRVNMRLEISELHRNLKTTMIYVTHDQIEAMTMADKIVVLNAGRIEQVGSPMDLYFHPRNLFVAGFIGSPKMNFIAGAEAAQHNAATFGVRPEHIALSREIGEWRGSVRVAEHLGSDTFLHVNVEDIGLLIVRTDGAFNFSYGDEVLLTPDPAKIHRFDKDGVTVT